MTVYLVIGIGLLVLLSLNVPVGYSLIGSSILALLVAGDIPMVVIAQRLWSGLESFPLLAIPFFILAGNLLNVGGGADAIFSFCMKLLGHIRGGLAYVNVLASVIFAGMTGAATADAAGLGAIEIKAMMNAGYSGEFSAAVTAASSIIGPIIPPSVPFVVYAVMAQVSTEKIFISGILPGLVMAITMMIIIYFVARKMQTSVSKRASLSEILRSYRESFFALMCPVVILGGIFSGFFTPTEAGAVAALYALFLGFYHKGITWKSVPGIMLDTALATAQVTFIVAAAGVFGWILTRFQLPAAITSTLLTLTGSRIVVLLLITGVMLVMGCFIDALSLVIMMTPVVIPIANTFGIDLLHMGVILVLACMTGLNTPPVGICLYIVSDLAGVPMLRVTKSLVPFYFATIASLLLLIFVPELSVWLPSVL